MLLDPGVHLLDLLMRLSHQATRTSIEASCGFWKTLARLGRRWAWATLGQQATEGVRNYGSENWSLQNELRAVVWDLALGDSCLTEIHPATSPEALVVTEMCGLYAQIK